MIGDVEPRGLCGSGLVDAVAELVRVGLLDAQRPLRPRRGRRRDRAGARRPARRGSARSGCSCCTGRPRTPTRPRRVYLSQRDVRELQFAKAAISTGWTLLLEELGLEHRDVQQVLLAGSFGSYLSAASAVRIGLVPKLPVLRIVAAGNVAGEGAKMALLSMRERAGAQALLEEVSYVELSDRPDFNDRFVDQLAFHGLTAIALIACGAIAQPAAEIVARRGWPVDVHPLPPLLHNQPQQIAGEVRRLAELLAASYGTVAVGYADCGTYGALDEVCRELGLRAAAGPALLRRVRRASRLERFFDEQPGTYLLTDFLVRSFARTVVQELGLDRYPELRDDYFGHYTRVVWLAQEPDDELRALAQEPPTGSGCRSPSSRPATPAWSGRWPAWSADRPSRHPGPATRPTQSGRPTPTIGYGRCEVPTRVPGAA